MKLEDMKIINKLETTFLGKEIREDITMGELK